MASKVLTRARTHDLTTLAVVKDELGITRNDATLDARLQGWITSRSTAIADVLSRILARQVYQEWIPGNDTTEIYPRWAHWPIGGSGDPEAAISVTFGGVAITDFEVRGNALYRERLWARDSDDYVLTYPGGFLLAADDMVNVPTLSFAASDSSINDSDAGFPLLVAGDVITVTSEYNTGIFTVVSRTPTKVVVNESVLDEDEGQPITLIVRTAPRALDNLCIRLVKAEHLGFGRDPSLVSVRVDTATNTYSRPNAALGRGQFDGLISDRELEPYRMDRL